MRIINGNLKEEWDRVSPLRPIKDTVPDYTTKRGRRAGISHYVTLVYNLKYSRRDICKELSMAGFRDITMQHLMEGCELHPMEFLYLANKNNDCYEVKCRDEAGKVFHYWDASLATGVRENDIDPGNLGELVEIYHEMMKISGIKTPRMTAISISYHSGLSRINKYDRKFTLFDCRNCIIPNGSDQTLEEWLRPSYQSGFSSLYGDFTQRAVDGVRVYDVNSLYPYCLDGGMGLIPTGRPEFGFGKMDIRHRHLYCGFHKFSCRLKAKEDGIPCIRPQSIWDKGGYEHQKDGYLIDTVCGKRDIPITLTLSDPDMELLYENYDVSDEEWIEWACFRGCKRIFKGYIGELYEMKRTAAGPRRSGVKSLLNGLIGKLANLPEYENIVGFDEDGEITVGSANRNKSYIHISSYVLALSRLFLLIDAKGVPEAERLYSDTDSLHVKGGGNYGLDIGDGLGQYKLEHEYEHVCYGGVKNYFAKVAGGRWKSVLSGLPEESGEKVCERLEKSAWHSNRAVGNDSYPYDGLWKAIGDDCEVAVRLGNKDWERRYCVRRWDLGSRVPENLLKFRK